MNGHARTVILLVVCSMAAVSTAARAQIGSGWTRLTLTQDYIDTQSMGKHQRHPIASFTTSGARYEKNGDVEVFELYDPSFNRVEHDTNYHYRTGRVQFEGFVEIYPGVNHQFIVQNFNAAGSGPIMALSAYSSENGRIVKQGGSVQVASNVFGKEVKVNIIHDLEANTLAVYVDGKLAWSGGGGLGGGGFNFKYGSYGSLNGSPSAKARWRAVQMWTGGTARDGGPTPDAGTPRDAGPSPDLAAGGDGGSSRDLAPARDVAAEDAGADPGSRHDAGGGADRGAGRGGSGGDGGGGSPGTDPAPGGSGGGVDQPPPAGCRLAGAARDPGPLALMLVLLAAWRIRRRRA